MMDITGPLGSLDPHQKTTSLMRLYTLSLMLGGDGPHFLGKLFILFFKFGTSKRMQLLRFFWEKSISMFLDVYVVKYIVS